MEINKKKYANLKKAEDKHGEIEFDAEIPVEVIEEYVGHALTRAAERFALPGFRKGKAPLDMVRARMDEMALLEDAADEALRDGEREIIVDEKLSIIGSPQLTITKIAPKNPIEFKVRFGIYPAIKLPDSKKIAGEIIARVDAVPEITAAEVDEAIKRLLQMIGATTPGAVENGAGTAAGGVPELTDETVQKLGPFKTVAEFKTKLKDVLGTHIWRTSF